MRREEDREERKGLKDSGCGEQEGTGGEEREGLFHAGDSEIREAAKKE